MKNGYKSLISNENQIRKLNQKMNIQYQNEKPFKNWSESL